MGDAPRRRLIRVDAPAALGFALLPQVSVLRPADGGEVGATAVWLLSLGTALPLAVRRLWPVPVFVVVFTGACAAPAAGVGPTLFLAAAYALYLVAVTRTGRPGLSAAPVAAHGGTLSAGPRPSGGFRIVATLPY
ncbi:hypothetical protein ACFRMQ_01145 [Kitasatospora sp. NPDC056783]|uniref:DUF7134 domain-containing protein n=1 Tax=Kitasatospora sp. NPDC056783 TaxID=3345943 RepID=UPI0036AB3366